MDDDATFRKNAQEAERMAAAATNDRDKASWLRISQGWMSLIRGPKPSAKAMAFDAKEKARGTNQRKSDASH